MQPLHLRLAAAACALLLAAGCGASPEASTAEPAAELPPVPTHQEAIEGLRAISEEQTAMAQAACDDLLAFIANIDTMSDEEGVEAILSIFRQGLAAEDRQFRGRVQEAVLTARTDGQAAVVQVISACARGGYVTPDELERAART
jgi:hypothetical protein